MRAFFFDTYAFLEIIRGSINYREYSQKVKIIITQLNLMELYYQLLLTHDKKTALQFFNRYEEFIFPVTNETIIKAMDFRKQNKKKDLSYADCIGYIIAKKLKIPFLTGDKEFEELDNVKFVK